MGKNVSGGLFSALGDFFKKVPSLGRYRRFQAKKVHFGTKKLGFGTKKVPEPTFFYSYDTLCYHLLCL